MKTRINRISGDWVNIKNKCRTTVNKQYTGCVPGSEFKENLLISEHSPIRLLEVDWSWEQIEYWLSTEWSRHKFEKFISTQRSDRTGVPRDDKPQGALVNFDAYANAQNLIDAWRKRLCGCAHPKARYLALDMKRALYKVSPELSEVLVPNCIYRGGCSEFPGGSCKFWKEFVLRNKNIDLFDIRERYRAYNKEVMSNDSFESGRSI